MRLFSLGPSSNAAIWGEMNKLETGTLFQRRFRILKELGTGGSSRVYHAQQLDMKREVSLKLLQVQDKNRAEANARFQRGFRLLAQLSHPHIMQVHSLELDEFSELFAVCEYQKGTTLRELLRQEKQLPWQRAVAITIQIANAAQCAHELGIVHRDIKPENILLLDAQKNDFVKLLDFGLSTCVLTAETQSQRLTRTGVIGTPVYMSPEQIANKADQRSDIYSLACLLFEMLSGEFLFAETSFISTIYRHVNECPSRRLRSIKSELPLDLLLLLEKMLEKDPAKRPQSMKELEDSLHSILEAPGVLREAKEFKQAKPALSFLLPGILILLIAAALGGRQHTFNTFGIPEPRSESSRKTAQKTGARLNYLEMLADDCDLRSWSSNLLAFERANELCSQASNLLKSSDKVLQRSAIESCLLRGLLARARQANWNNQKSVASEDITRARELMKTVRPVSIRKNFYLTSLSIEDKQKDLEEDCQHLLELCSQTQCTYEEAVETHIGASSVYLRLKRKQKALSCVNSAIELAKLEESSTDLAKSLCMKLIVEKRSNSSPAEITKSKRNLEQVLKNCIKQDLRNVAKLAELFTEWNELEASEFLLETASSRAEKLALPEEFSHLLYLLAQTHARLGKPQSALTDYNSLLLLYDKGLSFPGRPSRQLIEKKRKQILESLPRQGLLIST